MKSEKRKERKYVCGCGHCIIGWVREPKRRILVRIEPEPKSNTELKGMGQERALCDIFYPSMTTLL